MKNLLLLFTALIFITGCAQKETNIEGNLIDSSELIKLNQKTKRYDSLYETKRKAILSKAIKGPSIPLKSPDIILRVLSLPITDKNQVLHSHSYQFMKVEDGKWILSEYITNDVKSGKLFTPLKK